MTWQLWDDPTQNLPGLVRHDHQATAQAAAALALPRSGTQRMRVLEAIRQAGPRGLTRDEITNLLNMSPNTARPRIVELVDGGWVEASQDGRTRRTPLGRQGEVLVLTSRALEKFGDAA